ncbi:hypothetical protein PR202_gb17362 [Eleusine coracana subsp. coracana]|uniref:Uncharacterized protein n=1 Tax=Eleusine coracana subsp. coracana TaxID=191504 RepID=A0AAV5F2L4_ELECO|nr:hypothetical protein PR202_gb17362 [Eleusine coracana subsp. coracana]
MSFACGGFAVVWRMHQPRVLADGSGHYLFVSAWAELARTGTLPARSRPNHDRSVFRPRAVPSYSASLAEAFVPLDNAKHEEAVYSSKPDQSFVGRLYRPRRGGRPGPAARGSEPW